MPVFKSFHHTNSRPRWCMYPCLKTPTDSWITTGDTLAQHNVRNAWTGISQQTLLLSAAKLLSVRHSAVSFLDTLQLKAPVFWHVGTPGILNTSTTSVNRASIRGLSNNPPSPPPTLKSTTPSSINQFLAPSLVAGNLYSLFWCLDGASKNIVNSPLQ